MSAETYLEIHRHSIVIDAHNDLLSSVVAGKRRMFPRQSEGHADVPRLLEGGVTAQFLPMFVPTDKLSEGALRYTLKMLNEAYKAVEEHPDLLVLARKAEDVRKAKSEGKLALILSMEGAEGIEGDMDVLEVLYRLGLRMLGITWSRSNLAADGVTEEGIDRGLTEFGRELVAALNRLGIIIDVSHLAPLGVAQVLEESEHPVVASHSNAYSLCPHFRNLTDGQLRAIADKGGVICVTFVPRFLTPEPQTASIEHILEHIDHIVKVAGIEHVGVGSDFEGFFDPPPRGLEDVTKLPNLTRGLLERGYSREDVEKILGGNLLRVFEEVAG